MFSREIRLNFAGKRANWVLRNPGISPLSHFPPSNRYLLYTSIYAYKADLALSPNVCEAKCGGRAEISTVSTSPFLFGKDGFGDVRFPSGPSNISRKGYQPNFSGEINRKTKRDHFHLAPPRLPPRGGGREVLSTFSHFSELKRPSTAKGLLVTEDVNGASAECWATLFF